MELKGKNQSMFVDNAQVVMGVDNEDK